MGDGRLRELERRWLETSATQDGATYALESVRAGLLDRRWLELAAYCRSPVAVSALASLGGTAPTLQRFLDDKAYDTNPYDLDLPTEEVELSTFVLSLASWGWEPLARAALACAELQVSRQEGRSEATQALQGEAIAAVQAFVREPTREHQERALACAGHCEALWSPYEDDPDAPEAEQIWKDLGAPWFAAEAAGQDWRLTQWDTGSPARESPSWRNRSTVWASRAADAASAWTSHAEVRAAIEDALTRWVLRTGESSAVRPEPTDPESSYPSVLEWKALRDPSGL